MPKVAGIMSVGGARLALITGVMLAFGWLSGSALKAGEEVSCNLDEMSGLQRDYLRLKSELSDLRELKGISGAPESMRSAGGQGSLSIGGEINVDYITSWQERGAHSNPGLKNTGGWQLNSTNLRFNVAFAHNIHAFIKLDLSQNQPYIENQLLEEARLVWDNIAGGPIGVFFGKGEAPYGQDRTLGIIQSYNHTDGSYSPEGPIILNGPNRGQPFNSEYALSPVFHPGEIDRVVMGGVSLSWQDVLRLELAVYQPRDWSDPSIGNGDAVFGDFGFESFSARLWWKTPIEGLVAEISGVREHVQQRGNRRIYGNDAVEEQYAMSVGFDWKLPQVPLEIFAEYQHGWDWNYTSGYDTNTLSVGGLYGVTEKLRVGAMVEWLRIDDRGTVYNYNKFVVHTKYDFDNGIYTMAEYGFEAYNWGSAYTHMLAVRSGVRF